MEFKDDSTLCGLQKWFVYTFEKAGWIMLSHHKSSKNMAYIKKVDSYVSSIHKLLDDIKQRIDNPRGNGTVSRDFLTMHKNITHLKNYMANLTSVEPLDSSGNNLSIDDMSLQWMKHKYHHLFEKFGWMVLVKAQLDNEHYSSKPDLANAMKHKLNMYSQWIDILLQSIKHRIETSNDIDSENLKHDLLVMHNNVKILNGAVKNFLERNLTVDIKNTNNIELKQSLLSETSDEISDTLFNFNIFKEPTKKIETNTLIRDLTGGSINNNLLLSLFN